MPNPYNPHTTRTPIPTTLKNSILQYPCAIQGPNCTHTADEIDHKTPLSQGGTNHPGNLQPVCKTCHHHKTQTEAQAANKARAARAKYPTPPHPGLKQPTP